MIKKTTKAKVMPKKTPTKKGVNVTNLIIIDASGSMTTKANEVRGGINQLLADIKKDADTDKKNKIETIVVDFSSGGDFNVLVNEKDSKKLDVTIGDNYRTRGMTALYDAIGKGFQLVGKDKKDVFVTIITDGEENASIEFNGSAVKDLMDKHKKKGWALTFMGTTETSLRQATDWGIARGNTMAFADNSRGVGQTMTMMSNARKAHYSYSTAGGQSVNSATYTSNKGKTVTTSMDSLLQSQKDQGLDLDLDTDKK